MKRMSEKIKLLFLQHFLFLIFSSNAHAYIDPGTGSFIIQAIMAIGASVVIYLGYPIRFFKNLYYKIFKSKKDNNKK